MKTIENNPDTPTGNIMFGGKKEVAAMLGVCVRTVDSLMQQGCPHLKLGRRKVLFDLKEVGDWLKRRYGCQRIGKEAR